MNSAETLNNQDETLHQEVLVSTDINAELPNIYVWDYDSGSNLLTYNNCSTVKNGLAFLKNDFMFSVIHQKPFIFCWNLKTRSQQYTKITSSGVINSLAISSCGNYIVVGVGEKCFVWQTFSGKCVATLTRHFQRITKITFALNDQYLVTGSEDSMILVWDFNEILTQKSDLSNPAHTLNSHSLTINDLFASKTTERLLSVASDQTCKLWNLLNGCLSSSILFNVVPTRIIFDNLENNVYVAFLNGTVGHLTIKTLLNESNRILNENHYGTFVGHKQKINCMAISMDDGTLATGSDDSTIRIWDTLSKQCVKLLSHSGVVTNLEFKLGSYFFNTDKSSPTAPLPTRFSNDNDFNPEGAITRIIKQESKSSQKSLQLADFISTNELNENHDEYFELKNKFDTVKQINEKIYNYALNEILK